YALGRDIRDLKSPEDISLWNAGQVPIALIHPMSAGHGLNFQSGGHILIWFGLTWSLELYQQTNARLWRQGQRSVVTIHHIVTKDSVDRDVLAGLASKNLTQAKLIEAVKAQLGRDEQCNQTRRNGQDCEGDAIKEAADSETQR
ncbi:MAG: DEAD/DEAH box helicase, partial [Synergistaceae bacterium]|nr:DEAD/DEAH box helicase [Synergistaceae bacterium]